jgi:hypothetical protein
MLLQSFRHGGASGIASNRRGRGEGAEHAERLVALSDLRAFSALSAVKDGACGALQLSDKRGS